MSDETISRAPQREFVARNEFPLASANNAWARTATRSEPVVSVGAPLAPEAPEKPGDLGHAGPSTAPRNPETQVADDARGEPPAEGYVAGEGYWQGRNIPADDVTGFQYVGEVLHHSGVPQKVGGAAVDWLYEAAKTGEALLTHTETAAHTYDVSRYRMSAEDRIVATHFLNRMAKAGASQQDVDALLRLWEDGQARIAKREARARR